LALFDIEQIAAYSSGRFNCLTSSLPSAGERGVSAVHDDAVS